MKGASDALGVHACINPSPQRPLRVGAQHTRPRSSRYLPSGRCFCPVAHRRDSPWPAIAHCTRALHTNALHTNPVQPPCSLHKCRPRPLLCMDAESPASVAPMDRPPPLFETPTSAHGTTSRNIESISSPSPSPSPSCCVVAKSIVAHDAVRRPPSTVHSLDTASLNVRASSSNHHHLSST